MSRTTREINRITTTIISMSVRLLFYALVFFLLYEGDVYKRQVQDGCNQFCSYCIIPYTRGRVRSRAIGDVVKEVEGLAGAGYKEIVLTGIHLSSYGVDFPEEKRENLLSLITCLDKIQGIERIRLGSLEPRIITEEFVSALAGLKSICPHFHLSLQSGCNATLARMNRHYTAQEYLERCVILRKHFDNPAITTDVIVEMCIRDRYRRNIWNDHWETDGGRPDGNDGNKRGQKVQAE